ncbi:MAG: SCP-like extracellular [Spirochaetes bacterium]|nr:MAG: SCP-like extracellular [Spirochaetota bacterium]
MRKLIPVLTVLALFTGALAYLAVMRDPGYAGDKEAIAEVLAAHNRYRAELGLPALAWSDTLAQHAKAWAKELAKKGSLVHATGTGEGENLWMGTSGYFSFTQMVDGWGGEKKYFKYGSFPDVSTSGRWQDVGHYTQVIWRGTTEVGCGLAKAGGNDILVCRYSPPGNYMGQKPY